MRVSKRELVAGAADPRPKPRSSSARALRVSTGTCEPARRQDSTPYISPGQMLEIASQLPRTWCLLSPACYLMYEGARGHGGIQTPIYPPSRIARVSGRPVVPLLKRGGVGEEDDRAAFCSLASAIRRHRASLCSLPTCMYCADAVGGTLWTSAAGGLGLCVTACQMSSPGRWY
ncbi:hypothetical protein M441DRAFT_388728 [Trichoderma asperellum CBS 433.97]|uniref:Uncharacterized protein n=1 Tax=Trichoderma asperellum (strain ATCC 204424 / CBS 433.97 / NBRC 101777) TaxID=1042311 RepID=A0A2T3ZC39_TRIA4|nr:hypothetical protein M441DRAFT_388728 [Trichoderma asperellum CBS 433.97]PTB42352.1 hypothetical protein M441DRAFT_388728 [Trichoderma asperellum CBS 433.97]